MFATRRDLLTIVARLTLCGVAAAAGFLSPRKVIAAWNSRAFGIKGVNSTIEALGGKGVADSADIRIVAAEIAENGQVVPVRIVSSIANTESISILIERNPSTLAASFDIPAGTEADITTRIKMAETSNVYGVVRAGGKYYKASKEIKVTLGGC